MVNCMTLPIAELAADFLAGTATVPFGLYANAGISQPTREGIIQSYVSDELYATAASGWIASGARLVGGCCGTTPATIKTLRESLLS